jgi:trk system potassium uptake protein TrkA
MKRFIIVGLGNFGSGAAETLAARGHEVIAIDTDEARVDAMASRIERAAVGDATQLAVLKRIGAQEASAAIVSVGDDITASILTTLALRDLKVPQIYVKVISVDHARVMERQGVTETIFPERESAIALGYRLAANGLINYIRLGPGFSIQEMAVPPQWIGQSLRELELRIRYHVQIIALRDLLHDQWYPAPDPDRPLTDSDTLVISGREEDLTSVAELSE